MHTARVLGFKQLIFEIPTAALLKIQVFWDITQGCQEINDHHFEGSSSPHFRKK